MTMIKSHPRGLCEQSTDNLCKLIFLCHSEERSDVGISQTRDSRGHSEERSDVEIPVSIFLSKKVCLVQGACDGRFTPSHRLCS